MQDLDGSTEKNVGLNMRQWFQGNQRMQYCIERKTLDCTYHVGVLPAHMASLLACTSENLFKAISTYNIGLKEKNGPAPTTYDASDIRKNLACTYDIRILACKYYIILKGSAY